MSTPKATTAKDVEVAANSFADAAKELVEVMAAVGGLRALRVVTPALVASAFADARQALDDWKAASAAMVSTDTEA